MKRVVIAGATSGIGLEIAKIYLKEGWLIGAAGRREELLSKLQATEPDRVFIEKIDVNNDNSPLSLCRLIDKLDGMDLFILTSGVGSQNHALDPDIELRTADTNVKGFMRMTSAAFKYFCENDGGHIVVISSIAGTKGIGVAPAYSATKRFQSTYIDALAQLARLKKVHIRFTDIRPGFVATALLKENSYPMQMRADRVADKIVKAINRQKRVKIIDYRYRIVVFFWRLIPRFLWERLPIR